MSIDNVKEALHVLVEINEKFANKKFYSDVTFWGTRVLKEKGHSSSVKLDKISGLVKEMCDIAIDDLTPQERIAGVEMVRKLKQFYENTDIQLKTKNIFTRFLVWIRELTQIEAFTIRDKVDCQLENDFLTYSKPQFIQQFGENTDQLPRKLRPSTETSGDRITVREPFVRALLAPI
jgi:hypothetical protein